VPAKASMLERAARARWPLDAGPGAVTCGRRGRAR
jgi:hypothetical protein